MGTLIETYGVAIFLGIGTVFAITGLAPILLKGWQSGVVEGRHGVSHSRDGDAKNYWALMAMNAAVIILVVVAFIVSLVIASNP